MRILFKAVMQTFATYPTPLQALNLEISIRTIYETNGPDGDARNGVLPRGRFLTSSALCKKFHTLVQHAGTISKIKLRLCKLVRNPPHIPTVQTKMFYAFKPSLPCSNPL
jgi:hypothetical protein